MDTTNGSLDTVAGMRQGAAREGFTQDSPAVIAATTPMAGVPAEYDWLARRFGTLDVDWKVDLRSLGRNGAGRTIETFRLQLASGAKLDVHFDITGFHQL